MYLRDSNIDVRGVFAPAVIKKLIALWHSLLHEKEHQEEMSQTHKFNLQKRIPKAQTIQTINTSAEDANSSANDTDNNSDQHETSE